ncbi:MAG: hypothetical protein U1E05_22920, partial [Patescibacteria group bacterium]|nr:hypothetical protein [Patescibacteria group bacterium]
MGRSSVDSKAARCVEIGLTLLLAAALSTGLAKAASPLPNNPAARSGESVGERVQTLADADWIDQDRRFQEAASEQAAEGPVQPRLAFSLEHTEAVLNRAAKLAARLRPAESAALDALKEELARLRKHVDALKADANLSESQRKEVYLQSRRIARQIAFRNPLLDFDKILFVKRHDPAGLRLSNHMVHQFYGYASLPGGGLFVLSDPFSDHPRLTDLLADAVVENGRLAGRKLVPGAFLRPDISYDGATILFPYTEGLGEKPEWSPQSCFHLFRVDASGGGLRQLTDGAWNDFDPCFLPDGRVAIISERRGGYLRCGHSAPQWPSPNFTLHSMEPDGSDIVTLSYHESQEWGPSVNNDGMIVYTRWDYVDRDTDVAHHKWICYPDGRDPRAYHGNYPHRREDRPWMEMRIRAIPGSHRYVAVAAAHHGQEFGSLVVIDPR